MRTGTAELLGLPVLQPWLSLCEHASRGGAQGGGLAC